MNDSGVERHHHSRGRLSVTDATPVQEDPGPYQRPGEGWDTKDPRAVEHVDHQALWARPEPFEDAGESLPLSLDRLPALIGRVQVCVASHPTDVFTQSGHDWKPRFRGTPVEATTAQSGVDVYVNRGHTRRGTGLDFDMPQRIETRYGKLQPRPERGLDLTARNWTADDDGPGDPHVTERNTLLDRGDPEPPGIHRLQTPDDFADTETVSVGFHHRQQPDPWAHGLHDPGVVLTECVGPHAHPRASLEIR